MTTLRRLHSLAFDYLHPTTAQIDTMAICREAARDYASALEANVPDGPDKTHALRLIRTAAMWVNVAITWRTAVASGRTHPTRRRTDPPHPALQRGLGLTPPVETSPNWEGDGVLRGPPSPF